MTPKTLDKYIAALKKKAAQTGMTPEEYKAELDKMLDELSKQYLEDKITWEEYSTVGVKIDNAAKNMALQGKNKKQAAQTAMTADQLYQLENELAKQLNAQQISATDYLDKMDKLQELYNKKAGIAEGKAVVSGSIAQGMTKDEYTELVKALEKKNAAGIITDAEWKALADKLDKAYKGGKKASEIEKEIGCDPGTLATDESIIKLGKEFKGVYGQAAKEIQAKLDAFLQKIGPEMNELQQKVLDGTITPEEYQHLRLLTIRKKIMDQQVDQLTGVMLNANQKAMALVNGEQLGVFAENANYQSYALAHDAKLNLMFSIYDEHTAEMLIQAKPELLPRKEVNGKKDQAWNREQIAAAVAQGVLQGDSIPKLAKRIAVQTGETNMKAMTRYARTAMTSAQNAGRMEMLHRAQGMGIKAKKVWLATLDSRTRDSHQHLDGTAVGIDEKFPNKLMFPGDPSGAPAEVYNCRCTLIYDYEGFPNDPGLDKRIQYDEYFTTETDEKGKEHKVFHRTSSLVQDMSYDEWKAVKEHDKLAALDTAKHQLAEAQKAFVKAKVKEDKVYEGLWKDPVTLADYPDKKDGIQAKHDWYTAKIEEYKQAQAQGASWATQDKIDELVKKRKLLKEFEANGQLLEARNDALKKVQDIYDQVGHNKAAAIPQVPVEAKKQAKKAAAASGGTSTGAAAQTGAGMSLSSAGEKQTPFTPDAYSKDRKDKALWTTDRDKVDSMMRDRTGEVWANASVAERDAIFEYTQSYSKYNEPLRGIEYGTSRYLGVGNTDLNASYAKNGERLNLMTDIIDRCSYDHDMWLQRGCRFTGMDKFFQIDMNLLENGSEKELQDALLGKTVTEYGFMSMGSAKGKGFSGDVLLNVYAPSGTKMMYVEPFSYYGHDKNGMMSKLKGKKWNGKTKQPTYGQEFETIMQQGTQFRVTKVERKRGQLYVDIEVSNQDNQQRWKP